MANIRTQKEFSYIKDSWKWLYKGKGKRKIM